MRTRRRGWGGAQNRLVMAASVNTGSGLPRGHAGAALQDPSDYVRPPSPFTYDDSTPYWEPERLPEAGEGPLLSPEAVERFLTAGFLAVDGLWPEELVQRASAEAHEYFPEPHAREEGDAGPELSGAVQAKDRRGRPWPGYVQVAPSRSRFVAMPFFDLEDFSQSPDMALNEIGVHPRVLSLAAQVLGAESGDVRSDQNVLRARYGPTARTPAESEGEAVGDQDLHVGTLRAPEQASPCPTPLSLSS